MSLKFKVSLHIYYCFSFDNILLLADFNMTFSNRNMKDLRDMFELNHLIKDPTYLKSSIPLSIDNFHTNKNTTFFNSATDESDISDHHSLISDHILQRSSKIHILQVLKQP